MTTAATTLPAESFRSLQVWQKAHELVLQIYALSGRFPDHELYGLAQQIRRCAVSVPANIAEGFRRKGLGDKVRFLNIAEGSLEECQYYLLLTRDLGYGDTRELAVKSDEIRKMLGAYRRAIENKR